MKTDLQKAFEAGEAFAWGTNLTDETFSAPDFEDWLILHDAQKKPNTVAKVLLRILGAIPFTLLAIINVVVLFLKLVYNYVRYGAEAIVYTKFTNVKINTIFEKLCKTEKI